MHDTSIPPIWRPDNQRAMFRSLVEATSRPGRSSDLFGALGGAHAAFGVLATLYDDSKSLAVPASLRGTGDLELFTFVEAPADRAAFILADGASAPEFTPSLGTLEEPEKGATLIVLVGSLDDGPRIRIEGPGVDGAAHFSVDGLHREWVIARARWCKNLPLGCDIILADAKRIIALPRTSIVVWS